MEYYNEKIQDYLKEFEEMNFFINFYLTNVGHHPEKALIRAMDECLENMETELVYNYSESLDYKCMGLSTAQSQIISYLKTNPEKKERDKYFEDGVSRLQYGMQDFKEGSR